MERKVIRRDYVHFDYIVTNQEVVRKFRLDTFKKFIKDDKVNYIAPVILIEFNDKVFDGYLLLDGNHRTRAAYDLKEPCVWALVVESRREDNVDTHFHGHHIKELKLIDAVNDEDIQNKDWNKKYNKKNFYD